MTKLDYLTVLSIQRDKLKSQYEKPGWNKWALIGALASLIWLFLSVLEESETIPLDSITILLMFIFIEQIILIPLKPLNSFFKKKGNKYLNFKSEFSESYLTYFFVLGTLVFMYYFTTYEIHFTNNYFQNAASSFLLILVILFLLISILFFVDIHFPLLSNNNTKKARSWTIFIVFGAEIYIMIGYFLSIENLSNMLIYKFGFIFIAMHYITSALLETIQKNPLLDKIDELIDELTFDQISVEEAKEQLIIIVNGLQFKNIISPILNEHLEIDTVFREKCNSINELLQNYDKSDLDKEPNIKQIGNLVDELDTKTLPKLKNNIEKVQNRLLMYKEYETTNPHFIELTELFQKLEKDRQVIFDQLLLNLNEKTSKK